MLARRPGIEEGGNSSLGIEDPSGLQVFKIGLRGGLACQALHWQGGEGEGGRGLNPEVIREGLAPKSGREETQDLGCCEPVTGSWGGGHLALHPTERVDGWVSGEAGIEKKNE